jgi:hypothetical protein
MLDSKKKGRVTLNDQRKSYCVVRSEYQPERKRKHGSTVFIPKYQGKTETLGINQVSRKVSRMVEKP